jgi:hypothetical protein
MTEYSRMAKGHFTSTGNAKFINLPFQPDAVELFNYTSFTTPANHGVPIAYWDADMGQGFAVEQVFNATPVLTTDIVTVNGISTFSAGLMLQYGPQLQISGITKANPAVVTTASPHGLSTGQVVILEGLFQSATTGMPQISLMPFVITVTAPTTFTIPWNTNQSNYTALSGSPSGAFVRQVLYPFLYEPGVAFISAITTGTTTTITTTDPHNFVVGQEIGFRIPSAYGTTQLNELPNNTIPGSPVYYYVTSVTSNTQFVCNANSTGFTAFATNQTVAQMVGQSLPQVVAVGDVNTGGTPYSGGALYPSQSFPTFSGGTPTINGPAISGAFVNNTSQGFIIGAGAGTADTSSVLVGANGNVIYWRAFLHDLDVF